MGPLFAMDPPVLQDWLLRLLGGTKPRADLLGIEEPDRNAELSPVQIERVGDLLNSSLRQTKRTLPYSPFVSKTKTRGSVLGSPSESTAL